MYATAHRDWADLHLAHHRAEGARSSSNLYRAMPAASLRSLLLICILSTAFACRASCRCAPRRMPST